MLRHKLGFIFAIAVGSSMLPASADATAARRYQVQMPFSDIKAGAAHTEIRAPLETVRNVVTDYARWGEHIKRFDKAHIIGRHGDKTDVYLQVPVMKGAAKVWGVVQFDAPRMGNNGEEVIVGRLLKGNIKRLDARFRLSKIDDQRTGLDFELLVVPDFIIPLPKAMVTDELEYAAEKAVQGVGDSSERMTIR
jgi:hypothetical protein